MATKAELIRDYLTKHTDEGPKALSERIARENPGMRISPNEVSNIKSLMKKEQAEGTARPKGRGKRGRKPKVQANGQVAAAPRAKPVGLADQVAKLQQVAAAIGKDEAKKILDLL
jgi:hypothetical protein